jgi:hypothetical protein
MLCTGLLLLPALAAAQPGAAPPTDTASPAGAVSPAPAAAEGQAAALVADLRTEFDGLLADPDSYARTVESECRGFPEGDLFPYLFPAFAYTNMAASGLVPRDAAREKVTTLLKLAIPSVVRKVRPPRDDLMRLASYASHATYLCQLNAGLAAHAYLGGTDFLPLFDHLSDLLLGALGKSGGEPLDSFPSYSWPFDTIPCLFSLAMHDRIRGTLRAGLLATQHFDWIARYGTDPGTGLPASRMSDDNRRMAEQPRGCDLSLRLLFLGYFDRDAARGLYKAYVTRFWVERFVAAGFGEWPDGREKFSDMDSGPILLGIGAGASAMGIGATRVGGDPFRFARLVSQVVAARAAVRGMVDAAGPGRASLGGMIPLSAGYVTGFLFGDAVLFFSMTWEPWPSPATGAAAVHE